MNRQPFEKPPKWWSPKLSSAWIRFWRPFRIGKQLNEQRLLTVDVRGLEHLSEALNQKHGVLITPNHPGHADPFTLYQVSDKIGIPFYFMAAWQVFGNAGCLKRLVLRHHGVFSVDREGVDLRAFRQAIDILQTKPNPLVIFPEGEVYHINERVTPFREGTAAIALTAAKKADRPVVCVPCAINYRYVDDPTDQLLEVMNRLEREIFWRPRPDLSLEQRIYRFAEGALALKELEYLGATSSGPLPERVAYLSDTILGHIEQRYKLEAAAGTTPERIKVSRQHVIKSLQEVSGDDAAQRQYEDDLDDLFLVVQLFSYPGNYVQERPSIERMAETLDKFEEDVLEVPTSTIRGTRRATVTLDEPITVDPNAKKKQAIPNLTRTLEDRVQAMLNHNLQEGHQ